MCRDARQRIPPIVKEELEVRVAEEHSLADTLRSRAAAAAKTKRKSKSTGTPQDELELRRAFVVAEGLATRRAAQTDTSKPCRKKKHKR